MATSITMPYFTRQDIREWCGTTSYKRGHTYFNQKRVVRLQYNPDDNRYEAQVRGSYLYDVSISIDEDNYVMAECDCPAFDEYDNYCKHIAAMLFQIYELHMSGKLATIISSATKGKMVTSSSARNSYWEQQIADKLIALFHQNSTDAGHELVPHHGRDAEQLDVAFICKIISGAYREKLLAIEMKLGLKRLYVVQNLKELLYKIANRQMHPFTKLYTYDPITQYFSQKDQEIIDLLIEALDNEAFYQQSHSAYISHSALNNGRSIFIPPQTWAKLAPLFNEVNVQLEYAGTSHRVEIVDGPLPFTFRLDSAEEHGRGQGYELNFDEWDSMMVMESYGYVLVEGKFFKASPSQIERISGLQRLLEHDSRRRVKVSSEQIDQFMERVIPGLKQVGQVHIAPQLTEHIVDEPLVAKLYLDLDEGQLQARLDYVYGNHTIPALGAASSSPDSSSVLLMRDVEQEQKVMGLLELASFRLHDGKMYLDDEEAIYDFLYHYLPELETLAEVFVTPSLKPVMQQYSDSPKATVDVDERTEWLEVRFEMDGIDDREILKILQSVIEKKKYYRLPNGSFVSLEGDGFRDIGQLMDEMKIKKSELKGNRLEMSVARGLHLMDTEQRAPSIKLGRSFRQLLDNMRNPDQLDFRIPPSLDSIMRDYQKYGFQWMKTLAYYRFGGILADDMGLGKTLQGIAYLLSEQEEGAASGLPALIVAPASLVYNWRNELQKFAPQLRVGVIAGDRQERTDILNELSDVNVVITSYPLLRRDIELYEDRRFRVLILDEAQAIKNNATQTAQAVKQIQADRRFALTGTPVENTLDELWSIFDAIFPELFSGKKAFNQLSREQVARKVRPFILRRLKSEVLRELPEKIETVQTSELTAEQKKLYMAYLARLQEETTEQLQKEGFQKNRMKILAGLTRLRQLCCHPGLFVDNYHGNSGKLDQLLEIVEECRNSGKRMLIFSQFTAMLEIIRQEFARRGLSFFYLDGQTPSAERVQLCQRFNEGDQDAFLISLRAGGTGLNLTGADTVILYDLWWNPAVEQQAADRAHRIGQKNVVQVMRLVTHGTIEEKMYELQQKKKDLIAEVIQPGEEALSSLTEQEIREILMIG